MARLQEEKWPLISPEDYIPRYLMLIAGDWRNRTSLSLRREYGLGAPEWRLMLLLANQAWIQAKEAARNFGMDKAAISRSLRVLRTKGYLLSRPALRDARASEFALNSNGLEAFKALAKASLAREEQLLRGLDPTERALLRRLLGHLWENCQA